MGFVNTGLPRRLLRCASRNDILMFCGLRINRRERNVRKEENKARIEFYPFPLLLAIIRGI
jgi:hypothetical protein